jgi:hypothetical protein
MNIAINISEPCRICYEHGDEDALRLCRCNSQVHRGCLKQWQESGDPIRRERCEVCHYRYRYFEDPVPFRGFTIIYSRMFGENNEIPGNYMRGSLSMILFHSLYLMTTSGLIYGLDGNRQIANSTGVHYDGGYRIYYDLSFAFYALLIYSLFIVELRRLTCKQWREYLKLLVCSCTNTHAYLLLYVVVCGSLAIQFWTTVVFDILFTIPTFHMTCLLHYETLSSLKKSMRIGELMPYVPSNDTDELLA